MIDSLKKKIKGHWMRIGIVLLIIGIAIGVGVFWTYLPIGEVQDIMNMPGSEIHEGKAVMYVTYSFDYFSYFTDDYDNVVIKQYLVPVGDENSEEWMGLQLSGSKMNRLDANTELYWNWEGDEDGFWEAVDVFQIRGTVEKMDAETAEFYQGYIDELEISDEEKEVFLPYIFIPAAPLNDSEGSASDKVVACVFVWAFLIAGVAIIIYALSESFMKDYKRYIKKVGTKEEADRRIIKCMNNSAPLNGIYIDEDLFIYAPKNNLFIADVKDVIWVYQYVLTRKSGLITVGKEYSVKVKKTDGTEINIPSKKHEVEGIINFIMHRIPDIIVGFSDDLNGLYSKDRHSFVQEIERRRAERTAANSPVQKEAYAPAPEPSANTISAEEQAEIDRAYAEAMSTGSGSMYEAEPEEDENYDASVYDGPEDSEDESKPSDFNFFD